MGFVKNSAAGNSLFQVDGSAISDIAQPNIVGGSAANLGVDGSLANTPPSNNKPHHKLSRYAVVDEYLVSNDDIQVWAEDDAITVSASIELNRHIVPSDIGREVLLYNIFDGSAMYCKITGIAGDEDTTIHLDNPRNFPITGFINVNVSNGERFIAFMKEVDANGYQALVGTNVTPVFQNTEITNRKTLKTVKTATAIKEGKFNHSSNSFDEDYPEASDDTSATSITSDNALSQTRLTHGNGLVPKNTGR